MAKSCLPNSSPAELLPTCDVTLQGPGSYAPTFNFVSQGKFKGKRSTEHTGGNTALGAIRAKLVWGEGTLVGKLSQPQGNRSVITRLGITGVEFILSQGTLDTKLSTCPRPVAPGAAQCKAHSLSSPPSKH